MRDFLVGVFPLRFETTSGIAGGHRAARRVWPAADWWHTYRDHLEAVGTADVHAVARELIRPDEALILLAGDASKLRAELEAADLGPVQVVAAA